MGVGPFGISIGMNANGAPNITMKIGGVVFKVPTIKDAMKFISNPIGILQNASANSQAKIKDGFNKTQQFMKENPINSAIKNAVNASFQASKNFGNMTVNMIKKNPLNGIIAGLKNASAGAVSGTANATNHFVNGPIKGAVQGLMNATKGLLKGINSINPFNIINNIWKQIQKNTNNVLNTGNSLLNSVMNMISTSRCP